MDEAQALIIFGDGLQALYYDDKNSHPNRNGIVVQPILIVPSKEIKVKYNLKEEDLTMITEDKKKAMWVEYPIMQIDWLCRSRTGALLFVWCAFDGSETPVMRKIEELFEWDKQRDKTESRLRAQISTLQRELENVTSNQTELMRKIKEYETVITKKEDIGYEEEVA